MKLELFDHKESENMKSSIGITIVSLLLASILISGCITQNKDSKTTIDDEEIIEPEPQSEDKSEEPDPGTKDIDIEKDIEDEEHEDDVEDDVQADPDTVDISILSSNPTIYTWIPVEFSLSDNSGVSEVYWDFGDDNASSGYEVAHKYLVSDYYTVTANFMKNGVEMEIDEIFPVYNNNASLNEEMDGVSMPPRQGSESTFGVGINIGISYPHGKVIVEIFNATGRITPVIKVNYPDDNLDSSYLYEDMGLHLNKDLVIELDITEEMMSQYSIPCYIAGGYSIESGSFSSCLVRIELSYV